jgi:hypothetical protein
LREETTEGRSERDAARWADRRREAGISGTFQAGIDGRTVHRLLWTSTLRTYVVVEIHYEHLFKGVSQLFSPIRN